MNFKFVFLLTSIGFHCFFALNHSTAYLNLKFIHFSADSSSLVPAGCETSDWSEWSGCSVTCGKGISMRKRKYVDPFTADNIGCDRQMVEKEMCASEVAVCQGEQLSLLLIIMNSLGRRNCFL